MPRYLDYFRVGPVIPLHVSRAYFADLSSHRQVVILDSRSCQVRPRVAECFELHHVPFMPTDSLSIQPEDYASSEQSSTLLEPPLKPSTPYTSNYCEENVYKLIEHLHHADTEGKWDISAIFISNISRSVLLWEQKKRSTEGMPVCWDYHVIALVRSRSRLTDAWIYDLDTLLPLPSWSLDYVQHTFHPELIRAGYIPEEYSSFFRIVSAGTFLDEFASDRSHMLVKTMETTNPSGFLYHSPCPPHSAIQGPAARLKSVTHNLMSDFVAMDVRGHGRVMGLTSLMRHLSQTSSA